MTDQVDRDARQVSSVLGDGGRTVCLGVVFREQVRAVLDKCVRDAVIKGRLVRVWAEAMSLGSCFRKVELSLGVEKCRLLRAQVKFHSSNRAQIRLFLRICTWGGEGE